MSETPEWDAVSRVMHSLAADGELADAVVAAIRAGVPEIGALELDDVVAHTRSFIVSGLHAVAECRSATHAELRFVEDLASTRAGQGVPITAMLASIHEGQRLVWSRAAAYFESAGVPVATITEAIVVHLAWSQAVQTTAIGAHRKAELEAAGHERDARSELMRALLAGPVEPHQRAALEAFAARPLDELWVLCAQAADAEVAEPALASAHPLLSGRLADQLVTVTAGPLDAAELDTAAPIGCAGPVAVEQLPSAYGLAGRALAAGVSGDVGGVQSPADVAFEIVFGEQTELGAELARRWFAALDPTDRYACVLVDTLLAHLDHGGRVEATAASLFVHPNTIRHRLARLEELAQIKPAQTMDARVRLWWAARAWRHGILPQRRD